jgi:hypothetical protein
MPNVVAISEEQPQENGAESLPNRPREFPQVFVVDGISQKIHLASKISLVQKAMLTKEIEASRLHVSSFPL